MSAEINKIKPEDEVLSLGKNLTFGLQHVLTMYGGLIAAPLVVGTAIGLNAAEIALLITASILVGG